MERRAVDAVFRALDVVALPGYSRLLVRVEDYAALVEESTYRGRSGAGVILSHADPQRSVGGALARTHPLHAVPCAVAPAALARCSGPLALEG